MRQSRKPKLNKQSIAEQLRRWGATEEAEAWQAEATAEANTELVVLEPNLRAVGVFLRLNYERAVSMAGVVIFGFQRPEIVATLQLMQVKKKHWPELFDQIRVMEAAAVPLLNKK